MINTLYIIQEFVRMSSKSISRLPYCYLIGWTTSGIYYYGRRTAKKCHPSELWHKYFTSSKEVASFRVQHGEPDIIKITKVFSDNEQGVVDCKLWESKFLTKVDARNNPKFLNKVNSDHKLNPINTGPCKDSRKKAISTSRKKTLKKQCPFCPKIVDLSNYAIYHGDNCKHNPNVDPDYWENISDQKRNATLKSIQNGTHKHKSPTSYGEIKCPHCDKVGRNLISMKQFHFDKCPNITGVKHNTNQMSYRVCCVSCTKEYDLGNFTKHQTLCLPVT
jgi:hypothetical protein